MKYLIAGICIACLLVLVPATALAEEGFNPDRMDHIAHLSTSYAINYTGAHLLKKAGLDPIPAIIMSSMGTLIITSTKEGMDPVYDDGDMMANIIGTGLSAFIFIAIEL